MKKKIKVAVCYAMLYRFRLPIFQKIALHPELSVKFFVGSGVKREKHANLDNSDGIDLIKMITVGFRVVSGDRVVPLTFNPTLFFNLLKYNPDVLLIQGGELPNNIAILIYAKLFKKPIVWWSLGEVRGRTYSKSAKIYRTLVKFIERRCTVFLGYSSTSGEYFLNQGYHPSLIFSLVNVVDTDKVKKSILKDRIGIDSIKNNLGVDSELILLFVGGLIKTKGITNLINAVSNLSNIKFHLIIVGDGDERKKSEILVNEKKIKNKVTFVGAIYDDVGSYFELADLLVMPGTGGLVVSEGMTHSLPIICSTGDGSEQDLVKNGRNGFIIPPNDINALTSTLKYCLKNPGLLKKMGECSLEIIESEHNIKTYMNTMFQAVFCAYDQSLINK